MCEAQFIIWAARELYQVMTTPIERDQRLTASRAFVSTFARRVDVLDSEERRRALDRLDQWISIGQIDGYTLPSDKETFSWLEGIVGTLIGLLED